MAKKYIDAELRIVHVQNHVIATSMVNISNDEYDGPMGTPGRLGMDDYDLNYEEDYGEEYDY